MRDLHRPGGGRSRMTYRMVADLVAQLPSTSRTTTAQRDELDPVVLAALARRGGARGWGRHSELHEMLARIGEGLDQLLYVVQAISGGKPPEPEPWRRPGVLGADERAEIVVDVSMPVVAQLNAERAEREVRRQAHRRRLAAQQAAEAAAPPQPNN